MRQMVIHVLDDHRDTSRGHAGEQDARRVRARKEPITHRNQQVTTHHQKRRITVVATPPAQPPHEERIRDAGDEEQHEHDDRAVGIDG